jgi:hypothetical protein
VPAPAGEVLALAGGVHEAGVCTVR